MVGGGRNRETGPESRSLKREGAWALYAGISSLGGHAQVGGNLKAEGDPTAVECCKKVNSLHEQFNSLLTTRKECQSN